MEGSYRIAGRHAEPSGDQVAQSRAQAALRAGAKLSSLAIAFGCALAAHLRFAAGHSRDGESPFRLSTSIPALVETCQAH